MGRKGVDCGCGAREDILDRLAALRQRVEVLETEINQVESQFPDVLRDVRIAEASAVSAAESAESSREIVESYGERLGAVEQGVIDVNDYAEAIGDDVSAIDTEIHTTRPYMTTNTEQTITAKKHIPTATVNDDSDVWVNKAFVQASGAGKPNNLVHDVGNEIIDGLKIYKQPIYANAVNGNFETSGAGIAGQYRELMKILRERTGGVRQHILIGITSRQRNRGWDFITLYFNAMEALAITNVLRSNIDNIEYVLSQDDTYWYLYSVSKGDVGDGLQGTIMAASLGSIGYLENVSTHPDVPVVEGVEVGRLTP